MSSYTTCHRCNQELDSVTGFYQFKHKKRTQICKACIKELAKLKQLQKVTALRKMLDLKLSQMNQRTGTQIK